MARSFQHGTANRKSPARRELERVYQFTPHVKQPIEYAVLKSRVEELTTTAEALRIIGEAGKGEVHPLVCLRHWVEILEARDPALIESDDPGDEYETVPECYGLARGIDF